MSFHRIGFDGSCLRCGQRLISTDGKCPTCERSTTVLPPCYCKHGTTFCPQCTRELIMEQVERERCIWREVVMETARRVAQEAYAEALSDDEAEEIAREVAREKGLTL